MAATTTTTITTTTDEAEAHESLGTKLDRTLLRLEASSSALPNPGNELVTTTTTSEASSSALPNPGAKLVTITTTEAGARESLGAKLDRLKEHAKDMASRHPVARAAAVVAVSAVGAYFLWPVAAPTAVAMMKAPGAGGVLVSRAAFLAKKQLYFKLLNTVGAAAAVAALV